MRDLAGSGSWDRCVNANRGRIIADLSISAKFRDFRHNVIFGALDYGTPVLATSPLSPYKTRLKEVSPHVGKSLVRMLGLSR